MNFEQLRKANEQRHIEWANGESLPLSFRGVELAGEVGKDAELRTAKQTVLHSDEYPSRLILPVIPAG